MSQSNFFVFCVFLEPENLVRSVYFNCFYSSSFTDCICFHFSFNFSSHCPAHGEATLPSRVCSLCMSGSLPEMLLFLEVCLQYPLGLQFVKITSLYLALFFSCEDICRRTAGVAKIVFMWQKYYLLHIAAEHTKSMYHSRDHLSSIFLALELMFSLGHCTLFQEKNPFVLGVITDL